VSHSERKTFRTGTTPPENNNYVSLDGLRILAPIYTW
jgi:hypothetical protein